jgi:multidrug efflux pump
MPQARRSAPRLSSLNEEIAMRLGHPPASVLVFVAIAAAVTLWIGSGLVTREAPAPEDLMEILVDPLAVESYRISYDEVAHAVERNNQLIAVGALSAGAGRIPVSIPGTVEGIDDVLSMAVIVREGTVVTLADIAEVRQTFRDPQSFARVGGEPTIALEIRKMAGANIIDTVAAAQAEIEEARADWPDAIGVAYLQNQADDIEDRLGDLENSVIAAVLLVMLVVVLTLGVRAAILVAIAIPGAFLAGLLAIGAVGFTLNIVVLFALILVIGMLVDGAIVVVDLAQRNRAEGMPRSDAFRAAAQRMAWPVTASVATTLAVFVPLLFWPGTTGQFMRFLPAIVIFTLAASLLMALVFIPVLGSLLGRRGEAPTTTSRPSSPSSPRSRSRPRATTRSGRPTPSCARSRSG